MELLNFAVALRVRLGAVDQSTGQLSQDSRRVVGDKAGALVQKHRQHQTVAPQNLVQTAEE